MSYLSLLILSSNGLHSTTSAYDPPTPRATVRLSNPVLRSQDTWHVHHWQSKGGSLLLSLPDTKEANEQKRLKRKEDKRRRQERQRVIRERQAEKQAIPATSISAPSRGRGPSEGNALLVEIRDEAGVPLLVVVWLGWNLSSTAGEKWQLYRLKQGGPTNKIVFATSTI
ncbi:hypothetical protein N7467_008717 [Penicillium canescens]|nr:hypothetical protein N7467_008717 [Penicillium canescens]